MDMSGFNAAIANSALRVQEISESLEEQRRVEWQERQRKEQQELENHDNLDFIANSSKETIEILKEMYQVQKRNSELLEEKSDSLELTLNSITDLLINLFASTVENGEIQEDLLRQANALACEISNTLDRGEKVDFKDKAADLGVQGFISAIGILLKMRDIIP